MPRHKLAISSKGACERQQARGSETKRKRMKRTKPSVWINYTQCNKEKRKKKMPSTNFPKRKTSNHAKPFALAYFFFSIGGVVVSAVGTYLIHSINLNTVPSSEFTWFYINDRCTYSDCFNSLTKNGAYRATYFR